MRTYYPIIVPGDHHRQLRAAKRLILQNINVVDVEKGKILPGQTVAITGDRISSITKASLL